MNNKDNIIYLSEAQKISAPKAFTTLVKPIGSSCNMRCEYCYYLDKALLYDNNQPPMSDELLKEYIRQYIEANDVDLVTFCWHGGEPLMAGRKFYEKAMRYQNQFAGNKKIENTIQTNGLLMDSDWCRFFKANNFLVGISLDGPQDIHDAYRKNVGGKPTFNRVMKAVELMTRHGVEFNTLSVVNDKCHGRGLEVYNFFKSIGSRFMQFLPAVEFISSEELKSLGGRGRILSPNDASLGAVSPWSVGAVEYGEFMCDIFDEWIRKDVGKYYVQMFDATLANWYGAQPGLCAFSRNCGTGLAVEHNGDVYSCDHFVYPEYKLGNITEKSLSTMYISKQQFDFGVSKRSSLPNSCSSCNFYFACTGGCPKHRFGNTEENSRVNYLCEGYKKFFIHVKDDMDRMCFFLKNSQAPANIMEEKNIEYANVIE